MTTIDTVTDDQIEALRREASEAGDEAMVHICDQALGAVLDFGAQGQALIDAARAECLRVIRDAEAQD